MYGPGVLGLYLTGRHGSGDPERSAPLPRIAIPCFEWLWVLFQPLSPVEMHRAALSEDKSLVRLSVNPMTSVSFTRPGLSTALERCPIKKGRKGGSP